MNPRPAYRNAENAAAFKAESVALAYQHRPPYPDETFTVLARLLGNGPRRVLDAGCGTGAVARPFLGWVDEIDAVDISPAMIEEGRRLPGGDSPRLHWIVGGLEDSPLRPPYGLITAGDSLHWMEWEVVMPRFAEVLAPGSVLAILDNGHQPPPWAAPLAELVARYSVTGPVQKVPLLVELDKRGLFMKQGETRTAPVPFSQSLADYIEGMHSHSALSYARMGQEQAASFDAEVRALVALYTEKTVTLQLVTAIIWGTPLRGPGPTHGSAFTAPL